MLVQQHEVLPDGREMITTTTITLDENGEATEETVTEIVESEEVEVEESDEEEPAQEEAELVQEEVEIDVQQIEPRHKVETTLEDVTEDLSAHEVK